MAEDLVARLRETFRHPCTREEDCLGHEAADKIEQLQQRLHILAAIAAPLARLIDHLREPDG